MDLNDSALVRKLAGQIVPAGFAHNENGGIL